MLTHPRIQALSEDFGVRVRGTLSKIGSGLAIIDSYRAALHRLRPLASQAAASVLEAARHLEASEARPDVGLETGPTRAHLCAVRDIYRKARLMPAAGRSILTQLAWSSLSRTLAGTADNGVALPSAVVDAVMTLAGLIEADLPPQADSADVASACAAISMAAEGKAEMEPAAPGRQRP
jgi:hypothetical protein